MNRYGSHFKRVMLGLCIVAGLLASNLAASAARPPEPATSPAVTISADAPNAVTGDDGVYDVGAEHEGDAPPLGPGGSDLPAAAGAAWDFYTRLRAAGYTGSHDFFWGNQNAWEVDWKRAARGGIENYMADNVDIAYYHDHGSVGGVYFPWGHTDNWLVPDDCTSSWGDNDNEWMAFSACSTLATHQAWANCMNGQHLILGYSTTAYDTNQGGKWADYMLGWQWLGFWFRSPKTVTQAWFSQCDDTQPSGVTAIVIAEHSSQFGDYLHVRGPVYNVLPDNYYSWWTHNCYKAPPAKVELAGLLAVPSYQIVPRSVNTTSVQSIAGMLGLQGAAAQLSADGTEFALTSSANGMTQTLTVSTASGGYTYQNLSQLWVPPDPNAPLTLPTPEEALALANSFILDNQALPGILNRDQGASHAETESFTQVGKPGAALSLAEAAPQSTGVDVMVAYGRSLSTGAVNSRGAMIAASVAGPGATTKVYLGGSGGTGLRPHAQQPLGLVGGSRDVQAGATTTVALMGADKAWSEFLADHQLAVVTVPVAADQIIRKPISDTFAYYEQPQGVSQAEMIPVYVFTADFLQVVQGQTVTVAENALVYVPASSDYDPPEVTITSPISGTLVSPGQPISFSATAAGGFGPFTYQWTSSESGVLGTGQSIQAALSAGAHPSSTGAVPQTISVKVTNGNGQSRVASITVRVKTLVHLPGIMKTE